MGTIVIHCLVIQLLKYLFVARAIIPARTTRVQSRDSGSNSKLCACACVCVYICAHVRDLINDR